MAVVGMPWIRIDVNLPDQPKVGDLCAALKSPTAGWYLIELWTWAARHRPDGNLPVSGNIIETVIKWRGRKGAAVDAFVRSGLLVPVSDGFVLSGWEPQVALVRRAELDRKRRLAKDVHPSIYARDGRACRYCGSTQRLSIDHITPVIQGGSNEPDNLTPACKRCNSRKGGRTPEQAGMALLPRQGKVT